MLEHSSDNNFILCQKILKADDLLKKVTSIGKENSPTLLLSENIHSGQSYLTVLSPEDLQLSTYRDKKEATTINQQALANKIPISNERRLE